MRAITYSLQFRGQVDESDRGLRKLGRAPGCSLETRFTARGLETRFVWSPDDTNEALLESTLLFARTGRRFSERGTIRFPRGHTLLVRGRGHLAASPDPRLHHGAVVWDVVGGEGQFRDARGRVTSNFILSDTGDLTENQLGVVFSGLDQGSPRRERGRPRATIDPSQNAPQSY